MDAGGAVQLDNWFPKPDAIQIRNGSTPFAQTPETSAVETMMSYLSGSASNIFACVNGKIYDVTAGGTITSAAVTGLSSNRWQWINTASAGGQFLVAVNGIDPAQFFDGTAWSTSPVITGPSNPNALVQVWSYKGRQWFVEVGTQSVWYLAAGAIGGAATEFPLGEELVQGGFIMAGATWTHDAGLGPQDYIVFLSSEGECLIYAGINPSDATSFTMIGKFQIGRPIGRRCFLRVGADLVVLCSDGVMPLSKAIQYDRAAAAEAAFTWNIQQAFSDAYTNYGTNFGWQILSYAKSNMAIVNVPTLQGITSIQLVMNPLTGAWCRFTGMNATSWVVRSDDLFFGGMAGNVLRGDSGSADWNGSSYTPIYAQWISAFNDLGMKGISKSCRLARPVFITSPGIQPAVGVCVDYNLTPVVAIQSSVSQNQALWDQALWDVAVWPADNPTMANWQNVFGDGYQIAATVSINSASGTPDVGIVCKLTEVNILYEPGGYI